MNFAQNGGRTGDHVPDPSRLSGNNRHVGRGEKRVAATGDVASDGVNWYVLVSEDYTGADLNLEVGETGTLSECEGWSGKNRGVSSTIGSSTRIAQS